MNREDIIAMAREAGFKKAGDAYCGLAHELERLAALVAAAEREACAEICDRFQARDVGMQPAECAGAIRARGNT
jgi:hypothetical protein